MFDLHVHRNDLLFEILPLAPEKADKVAHAWRQVRVSVLEDLGHRHLELGWSLREGHAALKQEGSQLVDHGCPMRRSRTRWRACRSSWSSVLIGTKRMFCRSTASAMASASRKSFLFDFTNGLTN